MLMGQTGNGVMVGESERDHIVKNNTLQTKGKRGATA